MLKASVRNPAEWIELYRRAAPRLAVDALIAKEHRSLSEWSIWGFCDVCQKPSSFLCDWHYSSDEIPNFRERLVCACCGLNTRQRLAMTVLDESLVKRDPPAIYVYEQVTPLFRVLVRKYSEANVVGSEYLGHDIGPGTYREGIRHEDALRLSFNDNSFDAIVSNDVYEHVPEIEPALSEAARILRPGGVLIATIPFTFTMETHQRARLANGVLEHVDEPMFHGNPLSEKGSLVFYDFGWDLLDVCRRVGFADAHFLCVHSFFHAYLGSSLGLTLICTKGG